MPAESGRLIKKAVVAVPPVLDFYFTPTRASALGAAAVADILRESGIETVLMNFPVSRRKPAKQPLPDCLHHLSPFLIDGEQGPLSFFSSYKRFGPSMTHCAERIADENPDILFISCFAWAYAGETTALADAVREIRPDISIAAGGAGVSVNPRFFETSESIDYVLPGEAEIILPEFLQTRSGAVARKFSNPDVPSFQISLTGSSKQKNLDYYSAILTRGCPKSCRFCSNHLVHGRKFRKTPPEKVRHQIMKLPGRRNVHINFEDDNLLFAPEYFTGILRMIKERFPQAEFSAENGLDYTLLTPNLLQQLIDLGFKSFNLSMASTSQTLLKNQTRPADAETLKVILNILGQRNISSVTYFICGLEGEDPETVVDNLVYLHGLPGLTGISLFYPVPGLPSGSYDLNSFPPRLCAGSSAWPWNGCLTTSQLITAFRLSRLSNLIKTLEGRVPSNIEAEEYRILTLRIMETKKLHSLRRGSIIEVPEMDRMMIHNFINRI